MPMTNQYVVAVTNGFGSALSSNAMLVVNPSAPMITTQPATQSGVLNGSVTFTVAAQGSSPLNYQWQFNGAPIPGAADSALSLAGLQPTNAGSYNVIVTNNYGEVT